MFRLVPLLHQRNPLQQHASTHALTGHRILKNCSSSVIRPLGDVSDMYPRRFKPTDRAARIDTQHAIGFNGANSVEYANTVG